MPMFDYIGNQWGTHVHNSKWLLLLKSTEKFSVGAGCPSISALVDSIGRPWGEWLRRPTSLKTISYYNDRRLNSGTLPSPKYLSPFLSSSLSLPSNPTHAVFLASGDTRI